VVLLIMAVMVMVMATHIHTRIHILHLPALVATFMARLFHPCNSTRRMPVDISYHPPAANIRCLRLQILMPTVAHLRPIVLSHHNHNNQWSLNLLLDQDTQLVLSCVTIAG